jgi:hypothetical protein
MEGEKAEMDELDIQVARRKELYEHELYAKVNHTHSSLAPYIHAL